VKNYRIQIMFTGLQGTEGAEHVHKICSQGLRSERSMYAKH